MQIDGKLLAKWQALRSADDTRLIAERANVTTQAIRNVFNSGQGSTKLFDAIGDFYKEKGEKIKYYL